MSKYFLWTQAHLQGHSRFSQDIPIPVTPMLAEENVAEPSADIPMPSPVCHGAAPRYSPPDIAFKPHCCPVPLCEGLTLGQEAPCIRKLILV